ncbi:hypothetical protein COCNU_01G012760 [Cocos nucifera]|uniref:NBS-LRR resistance protein n=1 Tax=Cocos nucifera TaxID=13894 RepID=A0A8K0MUY9_COCNU|nr:hypothetical protein COCNU_01G012760 [Cocos nucifera]
MAEAVVCLVVKNLGDFLVQEAKFLYGVRDEVQWIKDELRQIQCFLKDADRKRKGNDEGVKNWVRDIRDIAYQAEDLIETFVLKIERRRRRRGFAGHVFRYGFIFAFPDAKNGSRIIFTSRFIDVAKSADPDTPPRKLRFLDGQESWDLFLRKVFPNQDVKTSCPDNLEKLGRKLVKRCGGLPLALVVLGGMLSKKEKNPIVWSKVKKSSKWETDKDGKQCLDILALSYEDLPCDLKACFLYLGCFPEDSEIGARKVIRLWTAEGFIPARERETSDETAADYLEELVQRCMVQVVKRRSDGGVKSFRVHDLLRELCILEAKEARFLDVYSTEDQTTSRASRRVALFHYGADVLESLNSSSQFLRTLLGFNVYESYDPVMLRLRNLKLLRVIDLEGAPLRKLPKEIKSIIHLRYLGLRN